MCGERVVFSAAATFGQDPGPPKRRRADRRTPEGRYVVCSKARFRPLYIFLNLDYPNRADVARAVEEKRISGRHRRAIAAGRRGGRCPRGITPLGSGIGIHGTSRRWAWLVALWQQLSRIGGLHRFLGVTNGCVLLANDDLERLWPHVDAGVTRVVIHGRKPVAVLPLFSRLPLVGRVVELLAASPRNPAQPPTGARSSCSRLTSRRKRRTITTVTMSQASVSASAAGVTRTTSDRACSSSTSAAAPPLATR